MGRLDEVLYIPHGSDEREQRGAVGVYGMNFISHMVQMKGFALHG